MDPLQTGVSEGEFSDDGLKIVIESPKRKLNRKSKSPIKLTNTEKEVIKSIERELEETLEEKATKSNLSINNVKNILKEVALNEDVFAYVRQSEDPQSLPEISFQPKITRAKARELSGPVSSLPWPTQPPSEVQQLFGDELAEDSSGDEYVPAEEENEDDNSTKTESLLPSVLPATPTELSHFPDKTQGADDGIFKIPLLKSKEKSEGEPNIALRTRSKLSLSSTPLEVIEEAFIPPDITTDMYDMDCEDDVWCDFLKKFTRPLDEVTKATEDEDHDPEYNILADEAIDKVDKEELREDKAVKIPKKELNALMSELFEYADMFTNEKEKTSPKIDLAVEQTQVNVLEQPTMTTSNVTDSNIQNEAADSTLVDNNLSNIEPIDENFILLFSENDRLLLAQQIRQHIQILTQTFLLTYQHPEFHETSLKCKENLLNFKLLSENKIESAFNVCNLDSAVKLIDDWEKRFQHNTEEIKSLKEHVDNVIKKCIERKSHSGYIPTFPTLILDTISKSDVFIYPSLLPIIPFKPSSSLYQSTVFFPSEDELISIGIEQFTPFLRQSPHHLKRTGEVKLKDICFMIVQYMMPTKDATKLFWHILNQKGPRSPMNPIKYYYEHKTTPPTVHNIIDLKEFGVLPPRMRNKDLLPQQFEKYLYGKGHLCVSSVSKGSGPFIKVTKPPAYNKNFIVKKTIQCKKKFRNTFSANIHNKTEVSLISNRQDRDLNCPTLVVTNSGSKKKLESYFNSPEVQGLYQSLSPCIKCMKFNSSIFKKLEHHKRRLFTDLNMLPSMPFLDSSNKLVNRDLTTLEISTADTNSLIKSSEQETTAADGAEEEVIEKDNEADITALMIASSSIKNPTRKGPSRAEKKKEKLRKEYSATLAMLSPEDPKALEEKNQSYAQAFFDKLRERLGSQDYQQLLQVLDNFSAKSEAAHLYKQLELILKGNHKDLMEEFLTFLTPAQAKDVGQLIPYYMLSNMSLFLRKLEIYFKDQPAQLRKFYRSLIDLSACLNLTMDNVKTTILPLLKGNELLTDWFLQIFPCEPPPQSLLKGSWEQIDVKQDAGFTQSTFETITIPETEDPYGGPSCICPCHQGDDLLFKTRSQHCTPCGVKFLQGRPYIPTGKGLRLANITFNDNSNVDHNARLSCSSADKKKRRSEISPSKQLLSPVKEHPPEGRPGNDSEDDTDCHKRKNRSVKSPRKKRVKISEKVNVIDKTEDETKITTVPLPGVPNSFNELMVDNKMDDIDKKIAEENCDISTNKLMTDEVVEWDCNEARHSPEHSAESESEFCEESSQDNINTETDDSAEEFGSLSNSPVHSDNSNSNPPEEKCWTLDEDKVILETLQKEGDKEETFNHIVEILGNRTLNQVKERFQTLMSLLQKMSS